MKEAKAYRSFTLVFAKLLALNSKKTCDTLQDWAAPGPEVTSDCEPEAEAGGRVSAQSLTSDSANGGRGVTPPGDEVWAQKCHELDFQVRGDVSDT